MAEAPWTLPNPIALLVIILGGSITAIVLAGYAFSAIVRHGFRPSGRTSPLRYFATLAAAATIAVYAWGALHMLVDESTASQQCKEAVGPTHAAHVAGYHTSFVPLRFGCQVEGVGTYEALVPGYVNPTVLGLALLTVLLAISAALASSDHGTSDKTSRGNQS